MNLLFYPWENGEKPYFVNEEGYEWYVNKNLTQFAQKDDYLWGGGKHPKLEYVAFTVRKGEEIVYLLLGQNQLVVDIDETEIGLYNKVKQLKILYSFMSFDEIVAFEEERRYDDKIQKFLSE